MLASDCCILCETTRPRHCVVQRNRNEYSAREVREIMAELQSSRPWMPPKLVEFYEEHAARYRKLAPWDFEGEVAKALAQHERFMDRECICLYAGTNIMNPRAARFL